MKGKNLILGILILFILSTSFVFSAEKVEYDFDEVNVIYAVQFEASPKLNPARSGDVEQGDWHSADQTWLKDIITDSNPNITVLFGVIDLKKDGQVTQKEEFIKISGEKGSRRFLLNSESMDYYEGTSNLMRVYGLFWSAKRLEGSTIIKDFTEPVDSVIFMRKLQPSGESTNFYLSFFTGAEKALNTYQDENFPIMYSLYKPIAEFGSAKATTEDAATTEDKTNTTTDGNTTLESNNTVGDSTNIGGNITTEYESNTTTDDY